MSLLICLLIFHPISPQGILSYRLIWILIHQPVSILQGWLIKASVDHFYSIILGVILKQLTKNENWPVNCGTQDKHRYGCVWREHSWPHIFLHMIWAINCGYVWREIHDYIFFRKQYEQSTVATYCGISNLFIIHIQIYLFFRFTDKVRGAKTENWIQILSN